MALIFRNRTKCAICGFVIADGDRVVATSHFIADDTDPLWKFSDAGMHYDCFQRWKHRREFVRKYNQSLGRITWGDGCRREMQTDGSIANVPCTET